MDAVDAHLRSEVAELLEAQRNSGRFLEDSAVTVWASWIAGQDAGVQFGAWRAVRKIAGGGMATVYAAERADGQFRMKAALKILRYGIFGGEVRARFERERQILADLDHPGIVRLLDGGVADDGRPYLVMELVDGPPLMEYVKQRALPLPQRIALFLKICQAVEYAHAHHVLHRDLKPSNIRVLDDGTPKLLDFGIAKLVAEDGHAADLTRDGDRYLTREYASPEQAQGLPTEAASDIYSLGLLLYELITLERLRHFDGLAPFEAMRRICEQRPVVRTGTPYDAAIATAIEIDPGRRHATVSALRKCVEQPVEQRVWRRRIALVLALAAIGAASWLYRPAAEPATLVRITSDAGKEQVPSFSPDGRRLLYRKGPHIYEHILGTAVHRRMLEQVPEFVHIPRYAPGGKLSWLRAGKAGHNVLEMGSSDGSNARPLAEIHNTMNASHSWVPGGQWVVYAAQDPGRPWAIYASDAALGSRRQVSHPPPDTTGDVFCEASPDGSNVAVVRNRNSEESDIYLVSFEGTAERQLTFDRAHIRGLSWTPDGKEIVYSATRRSVHPELWRVAAAGGTPRLVEGAPEGAVEPAIGGKREPPWRLAFEVEARDVNIRVLRRTDGVIETVPVSNAWDGMPSISPSAQRLAFSSARRGWHEIWTSGAFGALPVRLTYFNGPLNDWPRWSPDESEIVFIGAASGTRRVYVMPASGGRPRLLTPADKAAWEDRPSFSSDGHWIYYRSHKTGRGEIWKARARDGSEAHAVTSIGAHEGMEAPGGKRLYFTRTGDDAGLWEQPLPAGEASLLIPTARSGFWALGDAGIYYMELPYRWSGTRVMLLRYGQARSEFVADLGGDNGAYWGGFSVSRDGSRIYWAYTEKQESDIMMLENFR
ncbi:MAG: protein kinase [Acidobacteria bacterium]|nr:protein kinase [Acidobacteriota bacterium]